MTNKERIQAIYSIVRKIIKRPTSLFLVLKDETEYENYLQRKYGQTAFPTTDINQFFVDGKVKVSNYTFLDGSSLITDLALLKSIAKSTPDCEYLEIGTWRGESIVNVAEHAAHCTSVNLSPEDIIAMGLPEKYAKLHGCLIQNQKNIRSIYANSLHFDFSSLNQKFDLIFVDGDHSYKGVKSDTEKVFKLLKDENSIIVWHDYGYNTETPRHSVIAAILDALPNEEHTNLYHVSNTLCAIYSKKKLTASWQESPIKPTKTFSIEMEVKSFQI
jgi:predicted O-methyltransferase YrrM